VPELDVLDRRLRTSVRRHRRAQRLMPRSGFSEPARPVLGWAKPAISAAARLVAEVRATTRSTPRRRRGPTRRYRRL